MLRACGDGAGGAEGSLEDIREESTANKAGRLRAVLHSSEILEILISKLYRLVLHFSWMNNSQLEGKSLPFSENSCFP